MYICVYVYKYIEVTKIKKPLGTDYVIETEIKYVYFMFHSILLPYGSDNVYVKVCV